MKVYAVVEVIEQSFDNDLCWEDGYYDDYYETKVVSTEYLAFYSSKKGAEKCAEYLSNEQDKETFVIDLLIDKVFNKEDFE